MRGRCIEPKSVAPTSTPSATTFTADAYSSASAIEAVSTLMPWRTATDSTFTGVTDPARRYARMPSSAPATRMDASAFAIVPAASTRSVLGMHPKICARIRPIIWQAGT